MKWHHIIWNLWKFRSQIFPFKDLIHCLFVLQFWISATIDFRSAKKIFLPNLACSPPELLQPCLRGRLVGNDKSSYQWPGPVPARYKWDLPPERGVLGLIAPDPLNFNNALRDRPSLVAIGRRRSLLLMVMSVLLIRSQGWFIFLLHSLRSIGFGNLPLVQSAIFEENGKLIKWIRWGRKRWDALSNKAFASTKS